MPQFLVQQYLRHRRVTALIIHVVLISIAYASAYALRFDFHVPLKAQVQFLTTLPYLLVLRLVAFDCVGLHRTYWRHVGLRELLAIATAVTLSSISFALGVLLFMPRRVPLSVMVLDWLLAIFLFGGVRFVARCARESQLPLRLARGKRTLVVGAGDAAERLLRQCMHDGQRGMHFVGLIDDDEATHQMLLHGVRVLGPISAIRRLCAENRIELIVIAVPSATGEQMRRVVERCTEAGVPYKILPSLPELLEGRAQIGQLRDVEIDDLLGRQPVRLDLEHVKQNLADRVVLVTGGAGSIGSELTRQIADFGPRQLLVLDQAESPLYFVDLEVRQSHPGLSLIPIIADVTDAERLEQLFAIHRPDYVFHSAAYKHVPLMEANVVEAVRNNVLGTLQVADCAARYGAKRFVLISSDKAVNPSSVMGATKRVAERAILGLPSLRGSGTDFRAVRFGNVLGSDGSVVPLFRRQLAAGGPLTVTHPKVRRYFMTVREAVQLVLEAATLREAAGRIAMLDMGEPVQILELAEQLIRLSGLEPYRDVRVVFTGLRPGEKLDEELSFILEEAAPTSAEKIRVIEIEETHGAELERGLRKLTAALVLGDRDALLRGLCLLVPEYRPLEVREEENVRADQKAVGRPTRTAMGTGPPGGLTLGRAPRLVDALGA
jgi:FlaA1/EpsC-like NDP-sugar epimerase